MSGPGGVCSASNRRSSRASYTGDDDDEYEFGGLGKIVEIDEPKYGNVNTM